MLNRAAILSKHITLVVVKAIVDKYVNTEDIKNAIDKIANGVIDIFEYLVYFPLFIIAMTQARRIDSHFFCY